MFWRIRHQCSRQISLHCILVFLALKMSFEASGENSAIGFITILCGWGFTSIALASIIFLILARRLHHGHYSLEVDDILLITAFIFTVLLISQTTWAIIDEGQGRHVADVSRTQISLVARVGGFVISRVSKQRADTAFSHLYQTRYYGGLSTH